MEKMKQKEKDSDEFVEEIINDVPKLKTEGKKLTKLILGKKTILKKKKLPPPQPSPIIEPPKTEQKSNAELLVESIVKTYWVSKWKEQLLIMKYSRQGYNKKRGCFRSFCMKMNNAMKYHQYLYLAKLFDKMDKLPKKENIKHDNNFGKLIFVKNDGINNNKKDFDNIIITTEVNNDIKIINNDNDDISNLVEIKINLPEIKEVEYKPENNELEKSDKNNVVNMIED